VILTIVLTVLTGLVVTTPAAAEHHEGEDGFYTDFVADFERAGGRLVQLAEAMPADKFSWAPNEDVRTVSEVFMHVVGVNTLMPSGLGATPPEGIEMPENPMAMLQDLEADVTAKDEVIEKLEASFAYAGKAVPEITDLETEVDMFGFPGTKRAYLLILLTHAHEHLGQAIAYARSNGVVPPWSQQQAGDDG
jgi:uncharacterized damage-inducible protein DinB